MRDMINKRNLEQNERITRDVYVSETCSVCDKEISKARDILIDVDTDKYICKHCASLDNEIVTSECDYLYSEEEI